jgi:hypothetical protein
VRNVMLLQSRDSCSITGGLLAKYSFAKLAYRCRCSNKFIVPILIIKRTVP